MCVCVCVVSYVWQMKRGQGEEWVWVPDWVQDTGVKELVGWRLQMDLTTPTTFSFCSLLHEPEELEF